MLQGSTRFEVNSVDAGKRGSRLSTLTEFRNDRGVGVDEPYRRGAACGSNACPGLGLLRVGCWVYESGTPVLSAAYIRFGKVDLFPYYTEKLKFPIIEAGR